MLVMASCGRSHALLLLAVYGAEDRWRRAVVLIQAMC